jgi:hypothetical protein
MEGRISNNLTYQVHLPGGQKRLREMILYIAKKCNDAPRWGKTKLNKILWRADFTAYLDRGVPVTGRAYQRLSRGPAPIEMAPLLGDMLNDRLIKLERVHFDNDAVEERIIAMSDAQLGSFSPSDLRFVDEAIQFYWDDTANSVSKDSHGVAWKTRSDGDALPYESALLSDEKLSFFMAAKLLGLAAERGWKSK